MSRFRRKKIEELSSSELLEESEKAVQKSNWRKAAKYLIPYVEKHPSDIRAKKILARVFLALNRPNDAAAVEESIMLENPNNAHAIGMHGVSLLNAGARDQAISELKRSLEMEENAVIRGFLYLAQGKDIRILDNGVTGIHKLIGQAKVRGWEDLMELIAISCRANKAMVNVSDILEAIHISMDELMDYAWKAANATNSNVSLVQIRNDLLLEFRKRVR